MSFLNVGVGTADCDAGVPTGADRVTRWTKHVPGRRVAVVDTTGAGDAFSGALAVGLAEGRLMDEAVAFANACCRCRSLKVGTASAMTYRADVEAMVGKGSWLARFVGWRSYLAACALAISLG